MNHISTLQFALSYVGVFLGAGFVSGQELWQFFACFGPVGLLGFLGTAALFVVVNYSALRLVLATEQEDATAPRWKNLRVHLRICARPSAAAE